MFVGRGFNDHYLIATEHKKYIFRVYLNEKYYINSASDYEFEIDLLEHLYAKGVPVANALSRKNGKLIGLTTTPLGERVFALFPFAAGMPLAGSAITIQQSFQLGKTMAEFHLAANSFSTKHQRYKLDFKYLIEEPLRLIS